MALHSGLLVALSSPLALLSGCGTPVQQSTTPGPQSGGDDFLVSVFGGDDKFLWGSATAAGQIEGAWNISKQATIWDDYCHSIAHRDTTDAATFSKTCGNLPHGKHGSRWTTPEVTDDFYHTHKADLQMLGQEYGMNALRVSIAWARVMPFNPVTQKHEANEEGIEFYRDVFAEMEKQGVIPFVTLFHWDLPNDLSWLEDEVVDAFVAYAELAFDSFPKVQNWATFNEPTNICNNGYARGVFAPGHKSTTDHLRCGHNLLKAHARSVQSFREQQKPGQIGIVLDYKWTYPKTDSPLDLRAAELDRDNVLGVWAEPIFLTGDYPQSVKSFFGEKMPVFTEEEKSLLLGSADFFGVNTYGGKIAMWTDKDLADYTPGDNMAERYSFSPCELGQDNSSLVDPDFECGAASDWLWAKPDAMRKYLEHVHSYYKVDNIYVTEFGIDVKGESDMTMAQALEDNYRQDYYQQYMEQIALAKKESGVPVKGIFAWSLLDNFEWGDGLNFRFGITYIDYDDLSRHPKGSALWWKQLIAKMKTKVTMV